MKCGSSVIKFNELNTHLVLDTSLTILCTFLMIRFRVFLLNPRIATGDRVIKRQKAFCLRLTFMSRENTRWITISRSLRHFYGGKMEMASFDEFIGKQHFEVFWEFYAFSRKIRRIYQKKIYFRKEISLEMFCKAQCLRKIFFCPWNLYNSP